MRPTRLEISGFTSFRETAVVDFEGLDYFALVGPTGAGKSTVIDAICFALYGSVPRYDDKRLVAPVISQGQLEAKVRFDFTVSGEAYTAVRVVRRNATTGGASVKEARLEKEGEAEPLAGTGPQLTAAVTDLLGLTFEHFTKCVVLPQGDFARFLHDDPKDRQEFLTKLLNLGVYGSMRQIANARAEGLKGQVAGLEQRLGESSEWATEEALGEAKTLVKRLDKLRKEAGDAQPALEAFTRQIDTASTQAEEAEEWLGSIGALEMPEDTSILSDAIAAGMKLLKEAEDAVGEARAKALEAQEVCSALPDRKPLEAALAAHARRASLALKIKEAQRSVAAALKQKDVTAKDMTSAANELAKAEAQLESARTAHQAQHLAGSLVPGAPCPVCLQEVGELPSHKVPADLLDAEATLTSARSAVEAIRKEADAATSAHSSSVAILETLAREDEEAAAATSNHPDIKALERTLKEIEEADKAQIAARAAEGQALDRADEARKAVAGLGAQASEARAKFDEVRDSLAPLRPPAAKRKDLAADWESLITWAEKQVPVLTKQVAAADKQIAAAEKGRQKLIDRIEGSCVDCEVEFDEERFLESIVESHTASQREVKDIQQAIADSKEMREQIKTLGLEQETAHQLGQHLSARAGGFVNWMVNEALSGLVVGATEILRQLSNDQYALTIDESGAFFVLDRHNADERRSARTLSGGETFLASLSLALALADQLAELAAEGAAPLDAIFLDEGFGTLDPETLDTVAATVENLAAGGRMVGIVTHVRELADRIDNQFRVRKDVRTSTIERVSK